MSTIQKIRTAERREDILLHEVMNDTNQVTGFGFFEALVTSLGNFYLPEYVMIGQYNETTQMIDTVAVWNKGQMVANFSYPLKASPCEKVVGKKICYYPKNVTHLFPKDQLLVDLEMSSYLGVPIFGYNNSPDGVLVILGKEQMDIREKEQNMMKFFTQRAGAEFNRIAEEVKKNRLALVNDSILKGLDEVLYFYNSENDQISWYGNVEKIIGLTDQQLKQGGRAFYIEQIVALDRKKYVSTISKVPMDGVIELDYRVKSGNGGVVWIREKLSKHINEYGDLVQIGLLADVTVKKSEEEVRLFSIIKAIENERGRVAMELHDGLSQLIVASKLFLSSVNELDNDKKQLQQVFELLDEAAEECTTISTNLMPKSLHKVGLSGTIQELLNKYHKKFFDVDFVQNVNDERFDENIEINLFRILQEAINNVVKYAEATKIRVTLEKQHSLICLTIADNGQGFDLNHIETAEGHGNGHLNIQSRVEALRGNFDIKTGKGKGTSIVVCVPLEKN